MKEGEPTLWLARDLLPRAAVSVLVGAEGIGKSLWWVLVVAHVTTGTANPALGLPARDPSYVLLALTEDTWADVRARLIAAGADLARVLVLCEEDNGAGTAIFPRDLDRVDEAAKQAQGAGHTLALVVVDCWLDTIRITPRRYVIPSRPDRLFTRGQNKQRGQGRACSCSATPTALTPTTCAI